MAFPVIAGSQTSQQTTNSTTSNVTLPGSIASGDLIIAFVAADSGAGAMTWPSPWVKIKDDAGTGFQCSVGYLIASGGETTVAVTHTTERSNHIAIRITGWHGTTAPEITAAATGSSTTPNPGSITASWGSDDNLFIAVAFADDSATPFPITAWPFTDNRLSNSTATSAADVAICTSNTTGATLDPGTFTMTVTETWNAYTIVVRPAAAGTTARGHAQAQADIKAISNGFAQAQADIKQTYTDKSGQAQTDIKQTYTVQAQSQANIKQTYRVFGQTQADIKSTYFGLAQAQADIKQTYTDKSGQSQADIKAISRGFGQAQGYIPDNSRIAVAQAQAVDGVTDNLYTAIDELNPDDSDYVVPYLPLGTYTARFGLSAGFSPDFLVNFVIRVRALGTLPSSTLQVKLYEGATLRASFSPTLTSSFATYEYTLTGPEMASITDYTTLALEFVTNDRVLVSWAQMSIPSGAYKVSGQAQADILQIYTDKSGQAQADIKQTYFGLAQTQADIKATSNAFGQAQGSIINIYYPTGQAQADIKAVGYGSGQCQADIKATSNVFGQSQADIKQTSNGCGQAQACIRGNAFGQAQADIKQTYYIVGQAQALIGIVVRAHGQAQADIRATNNAFGQAQGDINQTYTVYGQSQADIKAVGQGYGQAQAKITGGVVFTGGSGQAQATIIAQYIHFLDTFSRIVSNVNTIAQLNYPDYGIYSGNSGVTSDSNTANIDGSKLVIPYRDSFSTGYSANVPVDIDGPSTLSMEFKLTDYAAGDFYFEVSIGQPGVTDGFIGMWTDTGNIFLYGGTANVSAPFVPVDGYKYRFLLYADHTESKAKWWLVDDGVNTYPEPSDWNLTVTPNVSFVGQEAFFVSQVFGTAGDTMEIDNVSVYAPEPPAWLAFGQAQALIVNNTRYAHGQARPRIKKTDNNRHGQAQARIRLPAGFGQAQAKIVSTLTKSGQAQAFLITPGRGNGQAQATITTTRPTGYTQGAIVVKDINNVGQTNAWIRQTHRPMAQAQANIRFFGGNVSAQAQAKIGRTQGYGQAQALIPGINAGYGQSQARIKITYRAYGQAQAKIQGEVSSGQTQAAIKRTSRGHGNALAYITDRKGFGQAQGRIIRAYNAGYSQAQGFILIRYSGTGQAQALITHRAAYGQSQARVIGLGSRVNAQAQAKVLAKAIIDACGQSQAMIRRSVGSGQTQGFISGGRYLVKFNNYQLPGYAQQEAIDSIMNIQAHNAPYQDGSLSEYIGLQNKVLSLRLKVVSTDYIGVKNQLQTAATIMRSANGYRKLYIQQSDRYYEAMGQKLKMEKSVGQSMRTIDYDVEFEAKPWLTSDRIYTISGTGTITTDIVSRGIYNGGWTPAKLIISGTDVTVSGYNAAGDFTGFVSVSGTVSSLEIDAVTYTAKIAGVNANPLVKNADYAVYVGPNKTTFVITGATSCEISWQDRWYL